MKASSDSDDAQPSKRRVIAIPSALDFPKPGRQVLVWSLYRSIAPPLHYYSAPPLHHSMAPSLRLSNPTPMLMLTPTPTPTLELVLGFGMLTGVCQNALNLVTDPVVSLEPAGYHPGWLILASTLLVGAFIFLFMVMGRLLNGLEDSTGCKAYLRWVETETFASGVKLLWFWSEPKSWKPKLMPRKKVKYSKASFFDLFLAMVSTVG